MFLWTS